MSRHLLFETTSTALERSRPSLPRLRIGGKNTSAGALPSVSPANKPQKAGLPAPLLTGSYTFGGSSSSTAPTWGRRGFSSHSVGKGSCVAAETPNFFSPQTMKPRPNTGLSHLPQSNHAWRGRAEWEEPASRHRAYSTKSTASQGLFDRRQGLLRGAANFCGPRSRLGAGRGLFTKNSFSSSPIRNTLSSHQQHHPPHNNLLLPRVRTMIMIRETENGESKDPKKKQKTSTIRTLKSVLKYAWPSGDPKLQSRLVGSMACLVLGKAATILAPLALGDLVNSLTAVRASPGASDAAAEQLAETFSRTASTPGLGDLLTATTDSTNVLLATPEMVPLLWLASYGLARLGASGFSELRTYLFARVVQKGCRKQALNVFNHLHTLDVEYLQALKSGEIQAIMNRALKSMQQVLTTLLWNVAPTLLEFAFVLAIVYNQMGLYSSGIVFATFCSYFGFTTAYSNKRREYMKESNKRDDRLAGQLVDSVLNCEAVRHFSAAKREARRYDRQLAKYEESQVQVLQSLATLNFGQQLVINTGLLSIMALATFNVLNGSVPVGDVVAVNTLMLQLAQPLNFLGGAYRITLQGVLDLQRLEQFLTDQKGSLPEGEKDFQYAGGKIEFENIDFRALRDFNLKIPAGAKVGIVGPSGSGKSTILKLLARTAKPEKGRTLVDDQDLMDVTQDSYASEIGIVPQESILFNDTLRFNLEYAALADSKAALDDDDVDTSTSTDVKLALTDEEAEQQRVKLQQQMENACKLAQVHDVIEKFPDQYETVVGERGSRLSGGERQRISIARTLLRDPKILLFDEATASLDLETEDKLTRAIHDLISNSSNKTMLIVAHRLSTVKQCDFLLYIDGGKVAEMGSHEELLKKENGLYRKLWATYQRGVGIGNNNNAGNKKS
ncbi:unnamed protein product [Amoebophrya sp. A120]|nr:unnamed protein product [Amoebophrya sp. A120]|eukprot:GSA120T00014872001.1